MLLVYTNNYSELVYFKVLYGTVSLLLCYAHSLEKEQVLFSIQITVCNVRSNIKTLVKAKRSKPTLGNSIRCRRFESQITAVYGD